MELQYSLSLSIFIILFCLFWFVKQSRSSTKLPPGPWKLPVLGNLHNLVGSLPHHALRELARKHGPFMHLQLGQVSQVIISSPRMAREIMKSHDLCFAQRPELFAMQLLTYGASAIAFAPYGDYWRQTRKVCTIELLSIKRVQSFASIREDEVWNLIQSIRSSAELINFTARRMTTNKLKKVRGKVDQILENIIHEHRQKKMTQKNGGDESRPREEDLVDVLLRLQQSGSLEFPLTIDNIKSLIWEIFSAGTDTSSTTVVWAMSEMMKNPRVIEKAQAEVRKLCQGNKGLIHEKDIQRLSYLKLVIKETLRLHPPVPLLLPRECREACKIDGYEIPLKTRVIVNAWAIGRDPEYWEDAESFIPERFDGNSIDYKGTDFEYIPFGAGRRMCPGIGFGMANVELPLANLLYHFDWQLPSGIQPENVDMTEAFGATVGKKNDLYLIAIPFTPSLS
ncbi:desmethyl-deoxy-podophyllotoxin synthase-like [Ziziphus jujuba]|uniref:Desmethyl-deoxy-podophyllotoxin synthase-like n=1 Tax=Ziziphus jujuba TaxID=326968 RepID=A0ABM3IGK0_ZIZJJ|nr:desmethyl-deoxy-podophyllotoxin synthase-like [Ziziphus jujuba]